MWKEFSSAVPDHLEHLASQVQTTLLRSKADSSTRTYLGGYKRWRKWASNSGIGHMPANPFHVAVYLQYLINSSRSPSPVHNAVYSIDWAMQLSGSTKVSDHPLISAMMNASKRILGKPITKKEPISAAMLRALVDAKITDKLPSLSDIRTVALCLLGYAGFFRFNELANIRASDVKFFHSHASIFLESSKTDQFRQGSWILIARSGLSTCPVKALERYIATANINLLEDLPLFRSLVKSSQVRGISYSRTREIIKEAFKDITDISKIGVHSLRSGGATAAANAGVKDRFFKRHGRWVSENAKDGYIKDNFDNILAVSKSLGI